MKIRTLLLPALVATLMCGAANASGTEHSVAAKPAVRASTETAPLILAQATEVEVYFDGNGNRVLVDPFTGEVIEVQPPRRKLSREGQRKLQRERQLNRQDPLYRDDAGDVARQDEYDPAYDAPVVDPYDDPLASRDGFVPDASRDYAPDEFPAAPRDTFGDPNADADQGIERRRLDDTEVTSVEPDTGSIAKPGEAAISNQPKVEKPLNITADADVAGVQVLMDRVGASPGVIDGKFGSNVDKAFAAYREITGTSLKSTDSIGIKAALAATGGDPFKDYEITAADAAGPFVASIPTDYSEKAQLPAMSYTSVTETLAERFHMDENYLKSLNPEADFSRPGTIIKVANTGGVVMIKVARVVADKAKKQAFAYDAGGQLVAAYPATIGSSDTPSPTGTHAVSRVALNPNYTYNPKLNFKQGENDKVLTIPPGPNGPVGSVWIALDKPTYGIHGTPDPSKIGKTESHGCIRLTNWDAEELAKLVSAGVTVEFVD